ncbi:alkyl sulfatase C-terminal domain-containing protein [Actinomadura sp. NPDC000929]|uniref:alkyl sulfatase C-terminal domain-containing protein n=1 Tax=unclassified Actinomadura TaxID=2626254 RepID=UPI0033909A24
MAAGLGVEQVFDSLAIRVNGPKAWNEHLTIDWEFTDSGDRYRMSLSNGALMHRKIPDGAGGADLTLSLTKPMLLALAGGQDAAGVTTTGDGAALRRLLAVIEDPSRTSPS